LPPIWLYTEHGVRSNCFSCKDICPRTAHSTKIKERI
jgi:hypothetical protein